MTEIITYSVYILRCSDESFYVGYSTDVPERVAAHNNGLGATWTKRRRPVTLVYQEPHSNEAAAIARERQLKSWTSEKKLALIHGDLQRLKQLSKSRQVS